jgi:hypothetical protein
MEYKFYFWFIRYLNIIISFFRFWTCFESLLNPILGFRDALLACFPGVQHLMCYFHVKQACQVKLRGKPMKEQKDVLHDIDELHSTTSQTEYNDLYRITFRKWCEQHSAFAYYFENQWNSGSAFNQWTVFCCPPGVAKTNNSLESFNAMFKRSYTNHTRHTMSALYDIIWDRLLVDLSREVIHGCKVFQLMHKPDRAALLKAAGVDEETYHITSSGSIVTLVKKESNATYRVNAVQCTCQCKYYHKRGYCKHILYLLNWCNLDSDVIEVKRTFNYKGNTKRTKKIRGRIRDALPALQVN